MGPSRKVCSLHYGPHETDLGVRSLDSIKEVAKLIGISYRQIQYWDKTSFIKPSYRRRGKYRLYTFSDLIQLKVAKTLREKSYSIQKLRKTIRSLKNMLPQVAHPFVELTFLIEGDRILVFNGDVLMNTVSGQAYIQINVQDLREEVEKLYPDQYEDSNQKAAMG